MSGTGFALLLAGRTLSFTAPAFDDGRGRRQEGLIVDRETANLAVQRWLREVANTRIHGTTGAIPADRLVSERLQLQPVPTPYGGRTVRSLQAKPDPVPIIGMQHPLSLYDAFAGGVR